MINKLFACSFFFFFFRLLYSRFEVALTLLLSFSARALSPEVLNGFRSNFYSSTKNLLAQNACTKLDPAEVSMSRKTLEHTRHVFNHKIDSEVKPITNQKSSGRCWIFAILNVMRAPFVKMYNIEEFEFSQSYLFYWDKVSWKFFNNKFEKYKTKIVSSNAQIFID